MRDCASGAQQVDIFVYEGSILMGPEDSGRGYYGKAYG